ncbi:unnamed protein product [Larinioides sclopetarius]|uniref:Uncharacterized protein n=1 Tax=Larinioides sclopetarius TaxID=280406 RepID=A0AAV2ADD2_9ARAC
MSGSSSKLEEERGRSACHWHSTSMQPPIGLLHLEVNPPLFFVCVFLPPFVIVLLCCRCDCQIFPASLFAGPNSVTYCLHRVRRPHNFEMIFEMDPFDASNSSSSRSRRRDSVYLSHDDPFDAWVPWKRLLSAAITLCGYLNSHQDLRPPPCWQGSRNYKASSGLPFAVPPATAARHWGNFLLTAGMSCLRSTTRASPLREQHQSKASRSVRSSRPVPNKGTASVIRETLADEAGIQNKPLSLDSDGGTNVTDEMSPRVLFPRGMKLL